MDCLNRKKEGKEERISELKDKTIKTNLSNRETTILKKKKIGDLWDSHKRSNIHNIRVLEEEEKTDRMGLKKLQVNKNVMD